MKKPEHKAPCALWLCIDDEDWYQAYPSKAIAEQAAKEQTRLGYPAQVIKYTRATPKRSGSE